MAKRSRDETNVERVAGMAEASAEDAGEAMRRGLDDAAEQALRAADGLGAVMQSGAILAGAARTASQEWLSYAQGAALRNIQAVGNLARCRTMREVVAAQSGRLAEEMDELIQSSRRISGRILDAASTPSTPSATGAGSSRDGRRAAARRGGARRSWRAR